MNTWREYLELALKRHNESFADVIALKTTIEEKGDYGWTVVDPKKGYRSIKKMTNIERLNVRFDGGYGTACPIQLEAWTKNHVYTSYEYDGADFVISMPRNPDNQDKTISWLDKEAR